MLCAGLVLFAAGCQSKTSNYPEDHVHYERIVEAVAALRAAYANRNLQALQALLSPSQHLDQLQRDAQQDFSAYAAISLNLTIERLYIQGDLATVNVRWEGAWQDVPEETESSVTDRGHGVLVWSGRDVVRLERVAGNLPFGMANR